MARCRLPAFLWEYVHGGAEDEITLADNRRAFSAWGWRPCTLVDVSHTDSRCNLLGSACAAPLAIAPTGYNGMLWRDADIALARAAQRHGVPFTLSTVSCNSLEEVAAAVPEGRLWFQLYCLQDKRVCRDLLHRAETAGAEALMITTDAATLGRREWDARSYVRPRRLGARHAFDAMLHMRWLCQALWPHGVPMMGNLTKYLPRGERSAAGAAEFVSQQMMRDLSWRHIAELRQWWPGKLIVKGILAVEDARQARVHGADGVVVTNHGGRQLDGAPASLDCLPAIVDAVGDDMTILLDSGIRRGSDIAKAIALGADGVLSGRATLYGLAVGGEAGAGHALDILHEQLHNTLGLLGRPRLDMLDHGCLRRSIHFAEHAMAPSCNAASPAASDRENRHV